MEEYLTIDELCARIKFARQSIYNLIHKKKFLMGMHYLKPTPKKILFKWSAVEKWIEGSAENLVIPVKNTKSDNVTRINI